MNRIYWRKFIFQTNYIICYIFWSVWLVCGLGICCYSKRHRVFIYVRSLRYYPSTNIRMKR